MTWAKPESAGQPDDKADSPPDDPPYNQGDATAFEIALAAVREANDGEIATLREQLEAAECPLQADVDRRAAEQRAETERNNRADVLADTLGGERTRADRAERVADQLKAAAQEALHATETARAEVQTSRAAELRHFDSANFRLGPSHKNPGRSGH